MNISKSMEFIFVGALVLIGATAAATAAVPKLIAPKATVAVAKVSAIQTVVVTAKRLTAEQKAALAD
ncbi:hypothetical protein [Pseudoduganella namucuonensis]|uniref:Uncharacterized protein n=1 Tax=Pseudoduganella namucuonensis TaxID=1035707 RepID=A0A1I7F6E9_9BURK|nr:hypothetical protein [Pseudoduganella namucuonensis]SFU31783.1 hypothetical protein SAMN05216552_1001409 [Pseudoduganella namucuonensis]